MSSYEGHDRMNRATAEQILQGDPATPDAGHPRLADLLAAARTPAHPAELAGEAAAMAAFTAARHSPTPPARRPSMIQLTVAKLLTVKVAAVAVGVACAGAGGVALAANAGVLPAPISSHLPGAHPAAHPGTSAHPAPSGSVLPRPSGSAGPASLAALCREFDGRGDRAHRIKALDERHFGELVRQAGRKDHDRVEKFCAGLKPAGTPGVHPSGSARPGGTLPSDHPTDSPGGSPADHPGDHPGYPSGRPSPLPSGSALHGPRPQG